LPGIASTWYATAGHDPASLDERRGDAPWYASKALPSTADMTPGSAASSSPPDLRQLAVTSQHPKKSVSSAWPGKMPPHNEDPRARELTETLAIPDGAFVSEFVTPKATYSDSAAYEP
jgi:hypothetical protein